MSKRVVVICLLLCFVGLLFGWWLSGLWITGISVRPTGWWATLLCFGGFLCLPAGIGMMLGYRAGRAMAVAAISAGYLACASMLAAPLLQDWLVVVSTNGHPVGHLGYGVYVTNALLLLGVLLLLHWTLFMPSFDEHLA